MYLLEGLMQGLALWIYGLFLEIVEFIADSLLEVFNMDMSYFETNVPVTREIVTVIVATGWALLIGNLAFQALKTMMSGIGFEGEDPKILFCRTFVFSFLLVASRQICEIGLSITAHLNTLLQTPDAVRLDLPPLDVFAIPGSWLLVMIIGLILMFQIVKFFFEIAERYVVLVILTILAPLAFGVGGSKNTEDIFKGWARMYGSACLMMLFNTVFLKLLLSGMSNIPSGPGMLPWMMLIVAIARVSRKIDDIVSRVGLNVARTGEPISHGGIMYPIMVMRTLGSIVSKTAAANRATPNSPGTGRQRGGGAPMPPPPPPSSGGSGGNASGAPGSGASGGTPSPGGAPGGDANARRRRNESGYPGHSDIPGAQPAMSAASAGSHAASGKEPPPSRPPIGGRRERAAPGRYGDMFSGESPQNAENGKPPLSVDSGVPGGISSGRTAEQHSGAVSDVAEVPGKGRSGTRNTAPPLSTDSRRPDIHGQSDNRRKDGTAGRAAHGPDGASPAGQPYRPNRKVNIDIYRDDDPSEAAATGAGARGNRPFSASSDTGMRGGKPVPAPDNPQRAVSPAMPPRASGDFAGPQRGHAANAGNGLSAVRNTANAAKSGANTAHTESRSHTANATNTQHTVRNTANAGTAYTGTGAAPPGHAASPAAGRVSRGVGTHGAAGSAAIPGGAQRMTNASVRPGTPVRSHIGTASPSSNQRPTSSHGAGSVAAPPPIRGGSRNNPPQAAIQANHAQGGNQGNPQQPTRQTNIRRDAVPEGQPTGARPMRYRVAGRSGLNQPRGSIADGNSAQPPARPAPGKLNPDGRNPARGGEQRP